jgi:hypothetical protein
MLAPGRPVQESADQVPVDSPFFLGPDWAKPWVWSRTGDCYIHRVTKEECSITSFNAEHQRFAEDLVIEEGRFLSATSSQPNDDALGGTGSVWSDVLPACT